MGRWGGGGGGGGGSLGQNSKGAIYGNLGNLLGGSGSFVSKSKGVGQFFNSPKFRGFRVNEPFERNRFVFPNFFLGHFSEMLVYLQKNSKR